MLRQGKNEMALTEEQKRQNKAARAVKLKAYSARRCALRAAEDAAENLPEVLQARDELDAEKANTKFVLVTHDKRIAELQDQLASIQQQIAQARTERDAAFGVARECEHTAWKKWNVLEKTELAKVHAQFPDLDGEARWSAAAWKPTPDVQEAMDAARRAVADAKDSDSR